MTALEFSERVPMAIKQAREDFRFYFALLKLFIALFVARVILAIRINSRDKYNVLSVRRPNRAVGAGRDGCHLVRFPSQLPRFGIEIAHPNLCRIGRFRRPDESFPIRRKSRPLLMVRRWIQSM